MQVSIFQKYIIYCGKLHTHSENTQTFMYSMHPCSHSWECNWLSIYGPHHAPFHSRNKTLNLPSFLSLQLYTQFSEKSNLFTRRMLAIPILFILPNKLMISHSYNSSSVSCYIQTSPLKIHTSLITAQHFNPLPTQRPPCTIATVSSSPWNPSKVTFTLNL